MRRCKTPGCLADITATRVTSSTSSKDGQYRTRRCSKCMNWLMTIEVTMERYKELKRKERILRQTVLLALGQEQPPEAKED